MTFLRKQRYRYAFICIVLISIFATSIPVFANDDVRSLTNRSNNIRNQLASLDQQIAEIAVQLIEGEDQLQNISSEIITTTDDLAAAEANQEAQYESMKTRIRFMYEQGSASLLEMLFSAENMTEFLNKADFIQTISNYDRQMLLELVQTQQEILDKRDLLLTQQEEQKQSLEDLQAKKAELEATAQQANVSLSTVMQLLQAAKQQELADASQNQNNNQNNNNNNGGNHNAGGGNEGGGNTGGNGGGNPGGNNGGDNTGDGNTGGGDTGGNGGGNTTPPEPPITNPPPTTNPSEQVLLAAILEAEARPNREGMLAVATVIMNRVADPRFPNSIQAVIYQPGQFAPVNSGRLQAILDRGPIPIAMSTAAEALAGARDARVLDCFFFLAAGSTNRPGINIQGNIFFQRW